MACIAWCLLWSILLCFCPESPAHLLAKKDFDGARKALQFLRGHELVETELAEAQMNIEEAQSKKFELKQLAQPSNA